MSKDDYSEVLLEPIFPTWFRVVVLITVAAFLGIVICRDRYEDVCVKTVVVESILHVKDHYKGKTELVFTTTDGTTYHYFTHSSLTKGDVVCGEIKRKKLPSFLEFYVLNRNNDGSVTQ